MKSSSSTKLSILWAFLLAYFVCVNHFCLNVALPGSKALIIIFFNLTLIVNWQQMLMRHCILKNHITIPKKENLGTKYHFYSNSVFFSPD